jgi:hypothetical protein
MMIIVFDGEVLGGENYSGISWWSTSRKLALVMISGEFLFLGAVHCETLL